MKKIDARKLPSSALEEKRRLAVKLRKKDMKLAEIGEIVGVHADTVGRWLKRYQEQGARGLKLKTRGRREGSGRRLNGEQERQLRKLLIDKTPDQLKLPYALWTRESVQTLIKEQLGIEMPIRTVGHYLKRWGMTRSTMTWERFSRLLKIFFPTVKILHPQSGVRFDAKTRGRSPVR